MPATKVVMLKHRVVFDARGWSCCIVGGQSTQQASPKPAIWIMRSMSVVQRRRCVRFPPREFCNILRPSLPKRALAVVLYRD